MKKKLLLLTIAVLCLATFASADSFVTYSSAAALNPTDIIDWTQLGPAFTILSTPQLVSTFTGNLAFVGNTSGTNFVRLDEGNGWGGGFDFGESLVWTGNPLFAGAGPGPFAMEFLNPVARIGFSIEADLIAPTTATVQLFDTGLNLLGTFSSSINFGCGFGNGCVSYLGFGDLTGVNIGAVIISTDSGDPLFANDFAVDDPTLSYAVATPEPSSLVLLGSGLIGVAGLVRRKMGR